MHRFLLPVVFILGLFSIFSQFEKVKTEQDLYAFIEADQTNTLTYTETFDCKAFSQSLVDNAKAQGFEAVTVWVAMQTNGVVSYHVFVAFQVEGTIIWIEPQNDMQYVVVGEGDALCHDGGDCVADSLVFIDYEGDF